MTPRPLRTLHGAVLVGALLALAPGRGVAADAGGREFRPGASKAVDPELEALLERFRKAQAETRTMTAQFRQVKEDALFEKPKVQSGKFFYSRGGNFRWDYTKPERVTLVATKDVVQRWIPAEKIVQKSDIAKNRRRLFNYFGIGSDVSTLLRHFDAKVAKNDATHPGTDKLELRGKQRRVQKRIKVMEMWIDKKTSMPSVIRVAMTNGTTTTWEFTDIALNGDVPADTYVLKLPPGTQVRKTSDKSSEVVDEIVEDEETQKPPSGT